MTTNNFPAQLVNDIEKIFRPDTEFQWTLTEEQYDDEYKWINIWRNTIGKKTVTLVSTYTWCAYTDEWSWEFEDQTKKYRSIDKVPASVIATY